jgi:class 3 adenylate cyclase
MAFTFAMQSLGSEGRLERLIAERLQPGADKTRVDQRIWEMFGERWAVMYTDLSGFSRQVAEFGIIHFLQTIYESFQLFGPVIEAHGGILLKVEGDSLMMIFRNVDEVIKCAVEMQYTAQRHNESRTPAEKVLLCVGIGYGVVLRIGDRDVFGAEVNAASKLGEDTAQAGEILVTGAVRDSATLDSDFSFEPIEYCPPGANEAFRLTYPPRPAT